MLFFHRELKKVYNEDYQIQKAVKEGKLFKIEKGIYSDEKNPNYWHLLMKKYSNSIIASDTAYYIHKLTDVIPAKVDLATRRNALRIKDEKINQVFIENNIFELGKTQIEYEGGLIFIYDKERMLIELMRNQKSMSLDYCVEILNSYRQIKNQLNFSKVIKYMKNFKIEKFIYDKIMKEVM